MAANAVAVVNGYAIFIRNKKKNKVLMTCAKAAVFSSRTNQNIDPSRHRETLSLRTDCPFRFWIKEEGSVWTVRRPTCSNHNYDFLNADAFATYRSEAARAYRTDIIDLYNAGTRPAAIA